MRATWMMGLAMLAAGPALADVKAGVDAWAKGDFRKAVENWRGPAVAGDADAQFNLGQAYKLGRGVPVDPGLAESWFRKAALQGHEQAGDNYALALFQAGRKAEALPWLEKSVARGEPRTQLVLGTMLFNGDGVPRDYPRAYALMTRASAAGLPSASETLVQMDQYISAADREKGTRLAQQYALSPPRPAAAVRVADLPTAPAPIASARPAPLTAVQNPPAARPRITRSEIGPESVPMQVGAGGWAAQIGAFRDRANAEAMWAKVRAKFPGAQPFYAVGSGLIRLQASGYASKAAAQTACAKAEVACLIVKP